MRFLSIALVCTGLIIGQTPSDESLTRAELEIQRLRELVAAGAIAPVRLAEAEQVLGDARDETILNRTLYGKLTIQDLTGDQTVEMLAAAGRRLERQQQKIARTAKLVDSGVLARGELAPLEQELESRRLSLSLAESRAKLLEEIADMARREQELEAAAAQQTTEFRAMERFDGSGAFSHKDLKGVVLAFEKEFRKPLPISANGETAVHKALGFDHRGRVDVALTPDQPEGAWLLEYLARNQIPYFAFRTAIPGKATGAHIHIGPGSTRLRSAD